MVFSWKTVCFLIGDLVAFFRRIAVGLLVVDLADFSGKILWYSQGSSGILFIENQAVFS